MSAQIQRKAVGDGVHPGQGPPGSSETPQEVVDQLIRRSLEAKTHAYCPYSKFRVGAALLTHDDKVFTDQRTGDDPVMHFHTCNTQTELGRIKHFHTSEILWIL
ncbi:unnamed protein product [Boreogadus saida]